MCLVDDLLPVSLAGGINILEPGRMWLAKHLVGRHVWFKPLRITSDDKLECIVHTRTVIVYCTSTFFERYWHHWADERHGNPPHGNWELLVVRDKVGRPPGELGVSKSVECDIFPFSALTVLVGRQEGHPAWMLVCWWCWFGWSFARLIAPVVTTTSIILCFNKNWLTQVHMEYGH